MIMQLWISVTPMTWSDNSIVEEVKEAQYTKTYRSYYNTEHLVYKYSSTACGAAWPPSGH